MTLQGGQSVVCSACRPETVEAAGTAALEAFLDSAADPLRPHRATSGGAASASGAAHLGRAGSRGAVTGQYERYGLELPDPSLPAGAQCSRLP